MGDISLILSKIDGQIKREKKERKAAWSLVNQERIKETRQYYKRKILVTTKSDNQKPFVGVDGEGAGNGIDHIYWLLRVGDHALWHEDGSELQSIEILKWLADLGAAGINERFIPVSYFFDYDTTMILRHLPVKNLNELMYSAPICVRNSCRHNKLEHLAGYKNCSVEGCECFTYLRGGESTIFLDNTPNDNYIRVKVQHRQLKVAWAHSSFFTVTDVADFFQTSFVKTLEKWQRGEDNEPDICTDEELDRIRVNKDRRSSFEIGFDIETFEYNEMECKLLTEIMSRFRKMCYNYGIYPDMWTGPGRLAEDLFKTEKVPPRSNVDIPPFIEKLSDIAYFGGRAEGIHFGLHKNVISYDIASAYPHAYTKLPCLIKGHGSWEEVDFEEVVKNNLEHTIIVGRFSVITLPFMTDNPLICGLPMRDKKGAITFPTDAYGAWWYPEVKETINLYNIEGIEYKYDVEKCFTWRQTCSEVPGNFTRKWFGIRLRAGKSTRGIPIKLALNSLYGKAAQKVGAAKWGNVVWAGLLTAYTRARLLEATCRIGSANIISYQTDGLFCTMDVLESVPSGTDVKLGDWEKEEYEELFLIQSGVYSVIDSSGDRKNKTRGMRAYEFSAAYDDIKASWDNEGWSGKFELPKRNTFVTIKLGLMWNKPELIGTWVDENRSISFKSNLDKRDVWDTFGNMSKDGRTYAPGILHRMINKLEYGPHPFNEIYAKAGLPEINNCFSYGYSRELATKLNAEMRKAEMQYSYVDTSEPYLTEE